MASRKTDDAWEYYGRNDPYFGVLTQDRYSKGTLTDDAKEEFFASGERYVASVLQTIRERLDPAFHPVRALDFGCGVGRLVLPLAEVCQAVVGIDVSVSMLAVAEANARERGLSNTTFVRGDDTLSGVPGSFDFIHSFIVFQHIPPSRGTVLFKALIDRLTPDGMGVLHVTYAYAATVPPVRRLAKVLKQSVPFVSPMINVMRGTSFRKPVMQMNEYDVNELLRILQETGCHDVILRFSETSVQGQPFYGVSFFFRKRAADVRAHA